MPAKNILTKTLLFTTIFTSSFFASGCTSETNDEFLNEVSKSKKMATEWLQKNFRDKGLWTYIYNPRENRSPNSNNALRQLMASRIAADLAKNDGKWAEIHKKNLDFIDQYWLKDQGGLKYILYSGKSKLGANAMMLRTYTYSPFLAEHYNDAHQVASGIISLQKPDGSFEPWFKEPNYEYDTDRLMYFYSGEAILALVEFFQKTNEKQYLAAAQKAQDYYIEEYVEKMDENYYPAYVPWHTQSMNLLYKITRDRKYADAIFKLNDELLKIQDREEFIGRFYDKNIPEYGTPHSASDGVYTEGLAYAYEIAKLVGDDERAANYKEAVELGMQNIISLQYCNGAYIKSYDEEKVCGAIKIRENNDQFRVDNIQHAIDAMTKIEEVW